MGGYHGGMNVQFDHPLKGIENCLLVNTTHLEASGSTDDVVHFLNLLILKLLFDVFYHFESTVVRIEFYFRICDMTGMKVNVNSLESPVEFVHYSLTQRPTASENDAALLHIT